MADMPQMGITYTDRDGRLTVAGEALLRGLYEDLREAREEIAILRGALDALTTRVAALES